MRFSIHNSYWMFGPDPTEAFEAVKAKAQWAENHGFVWFSVLDHMIQIPRVGAPEVAEVRHKLAVLRGHCDAAGRDCDTIEKTLVQPWLLARDDATVVAKRERLAAREPLRGFVGTGSEAIDLIGQYQDAGIDLLIDSDRRNDAETRELFTSDVMPHFA
jgi:alkanesulfonate monooxygenase SsuD/methylene tetrahydromethanopterin reductase-like flavin-dependent oxidoreductase (luciferase family)